MAKERKVASMEDIQNALMDLAKEQKKTAEAQQKTEKAQQRTEKGLQRMEASIERVNEAHGSLNNLWGEMTENLVEGNLLSLLQERGFKKVKFIQPRLKFCDQKSGRVGEIDLMAVNGQETVAIEVKTSLKKRDVVKFLKQLDIFKMRSSQWL